MSCKGTLCYQDPCECPDNKVKCPVCKEFVHIDDKITINKEGVNHSVCLKLSRP